jgi:hypothetical protein
VSFDSPLLSPHLGRAIDTHKNKGRFSQVGINAAAREQRALLEWSFTSDSIFLFPLLVPNHPNS